MVTLIALIASFSCSLVTLRIIKHEWQFQLSGRIAMSVMLLLTGIGHFIYPTGMALMLPDFIPFKLKLIYFTGLIEIAAAIGLLIPRIQKLTAWLLIIFFISIFPANIYAAVHHVNLQTATYDGSGLSYLWFRVPLQILFIGWVYWFGIRMVNPIKHITARL